MTKTFDCNACRDRHQRPINSKCTRIVDSEPENGHSAGQSDINLQILNELKSLNGRMSAMKERVGKVEKPRLQPDPDGARTSATVSTTASDSVIPSLDFLRASDTIQAREGGAQWVSGFCAIIRDESDIQIKNNMLSYVADLIWVAVSQRGLRCSPMPHGGKQS